MKKFFQKTFTFKGFHLIIAALVVILLIKGCSSRQANKTVKAKAKAALVIDSLEKVINAKTDTLYITRIKLKNTNDKLKSAMDLIQELRTDKKNLSDVNRQNARTIKNMTDEKAD